MQVFKLEICAMFIPITRDAHTTYTTPYAEHIHKYTPEYMKKK